MIRRAQAEALLKLAEALEECERNGVRISPDEGFIDLAIGGDYEHVGSMSAVEVRMAIAKLYPKSEGAE